MNVCLLKVYLVVEFRNVRNTTNPTISKTDLHCQKVVEKAIWTFP